MILRTIDPSDQRDQDRWLLENFRIFCQPEHSDLEALLRLAEEEREFQEFIVQEVLSSRQGELTVEALHRLLKCYNGPNRPVLWALLLKHALGQSFIQYTGAEPKAD